MVEVDKDKPVYVISVVAEILGTTQQQLRIYEKEKLVIPNRTQRNTRLYSQRDVELLQKITTLHQELGVNLAGVEVILSMRRRMEQMQNEFEQFVDEVRTRFGVDLQRPAGEECTDLIPLPKKHQIMRVRKIDPQAIVPPKVKRLLKGD
jgi:MerR family transcriptional regulator/heat shock protein HspR